MGLQTGTGMDGAQAAGRKVPRRPPIDYRANLALLGLVAAGMVVQLVVWPVLLRHWGVSMLWIGLPLVVLTPTHWGLIHESIHGKLLPQQGLNEGVGRLLAIAFLLPFDAARFGHLMHHRYTRESYDRPDVHDGVTHPALARVGYYLHLLGGFYLSELVLPVLSFLPAELVCRLVERKLQSDEPKGKEVQRLFVGFARNTQRRNRMRRDWIVALALHAFAFYFYGAWWPVLAVTMFLRGVWLSVADNLPHYDVLLDEQQRARNFRVSAMWRPLLLNHHLHRLHHEHPTLPWTALPGLVRVEDARSEVEAGYFRAAVRQFRGFGRVS
jgi:fatty acid desaturase